MSIGPLIHALLSKLLVYCSIGRVSLFEGMCAFVSVDATHHDENRSRGLDSALQCYSYSYATLLDEALK